MSIDQLELEVSETLAQPDPPKHDEELYKKWFRGRDQAGFLSIKPWWKGRKFMVDIGKSDPNSNKLISNTNAFIDAIQLASYVRAVVQGRADRVYPENKKQGVPTPEGLTVYGGSAKEGVSRVFKAHYFPTGKDYAYDSASFRWGVAHYEGKVMGNGAIMPNMEKRLSLDTIKVTRQELEEINYYLELALHGHAARNELWYT